MDEALVEYLCTRRTIPAAQLRPPAPDPQALRAILTIAARVPDHGKLAPWRFIIYEGEARTAAVQGLTRIASEAADGKDGRVRAEKAKAFADAPLTVAVISAPVLDHPKIPLWEQQLSAGAVCLNLLHAAHAHGFAAQWLSGWFAYDDAAARWLGVRDGERLAGFMHIGTPMMPPTERDRPDVNSITSNWEDPSIVA